MPRQRRQPPRDDETVPKEFVGTDIMDVIELAEESDAFASAVLGGAFMSGIAVAVAWRSSLLGQRRRRHS
jgi:hypothetical protein